MPHALALEESQLVDGAFLEHYRCPERFAAFSVSEGLSEERGFFRFGPRTLCHGRSASGPGGARTTGQWHDVMNDVECEDRVVRLPFRPFEIINDLRHERYALDGYPGQIPPALARAYYHVRPLRRLASQALQRARLRTGSRSFSSWP